MITICITHFKDTDFILNTLYCLKHTTKNNYKVIIRDNNSEVRFYQKLKKGIKDYENVQLYRAENFNLKGSLAHGTALNDLVERIDTSYGVILDADCTFLVKNWDEILKSRLNDRVKIIGTWTSLEKVSDFPFIYGVFFDAKILKNLNIDFRPGDLSKFQDTAWQLKGKYLSRGYQGELLYSKNTRVHKEGPFKDVLGVGEYYLKGYNHIFASHFGRGSTLGSAKYKKGTGFFYKIPFISRSLRKMRGRKEIKKWISICREIVDKQI